ncbi:hypothetical protein [Luteolibacter sp. Populi]|uniref:hypothetical protein n=1 Tax=Luteolibacter sp. Populi TaxID=3230487 RepID=UPI0034676E47
MTLAVWHRFRAIFSICGTDRAISLLGEGFTNLREIRPADSEAIRASLLAIGYHELN